MRRLTVGVALLLVLITGCTARSGDHVALRATGGSATPTSTPPTKCCVPPPSPRLRIEVTPTEGPPGTTVRIVVTGCDDPPGSNHAVSFNNDSQDVSARNDPDTVRLIQTTQRGQMLRGRYTIVQRDATGGVGTFFVQCGRTLRQAGFHVVS